MSVMTVKFWGVRGSIPTPGRRTEKYGGNTTCLEVRFADEILVFDAGSGIRELSNAWLGEFKGHEVHATLFFTHVHWDHIQGFPFFTSAYVKGNRFNIFGNQNGDGGVKGLLSRQMQGAYFPVPLSMMQANLEFNAVKPEFSVGPVSVRTIKLPHPGGCLGYRLQAGESTFVLATDCELDQVALNRNEIRENHLAPRQYNSDLIRFLAGANMMVVDCQFTDNEYASKIGWGHNSISTVVDLCTQVHPDMVALCHHDPQHDDAEVSRMTAEAATRLESAGVRRTLVFAAREGLKMRVRKPQPPLSLA